VKKRAWMLGVVAALAAAGSADAGRPRRTTGFRVEPDGVRFREKIRSRHRFVVVHDQGADDVRTVVRTGKLFRRGLERNTSLTGDGDGTMSVGLHVRSLPGQPAVARSTDDLIVKPGVVVQDQTWKPFGREPVHQTRTTGAGEPFTSVDLHDTLGPAPDPRPAALEQPGPMAAGQRTVEVGGRDGSSVMDLFTRRSLFDRFANTILGERVQVGQTQTDRGITTELARTTSFGFRGAGRIGKLQPGGGSVSTGEEVKGQRATRDDRVEVTPGQGHRVEQVYRLRGSISKRIETWFDRDGNATVVTTRLRRNGTRFMATTVVTGPDGRPQKTRVFYRRDGITPRSSAGSPAR
jgi:hypothetical protein